MCVCVWGGGGGPGNQKTPLNTPLLGEGLLLYCDHMSLVSGQDCGQESSHLWPDTTPRPSTRNNSRSIRYLYGSIGEHRRASL